MVNIWHAARAGDVGEVERLVGQDPGLLNARDGIGFTPLMLASRRGHVGVVRFLLDKGAAVNETSVVAAPLYIMHATIFCMPRWPRLPGEATDRERGGTRHRHELGLESLQDRF
jgi:hypothetical protein